MALKRIMLAIIALLLPGCAREPHLGWVKSGKVGVASAERRALESLFAQSRDSDVKLVLGKGSLGGFGSRAVQIDEGRVLGLATLKNTEFEALAAFSELERLVMYRSPARTLDGLGPWPKLRELRLEFSELETLAGIARCCPQLEKLSLSHGSISDLRELGALTRLVELHLDHTELTDLSSAPPLPSLKIFQLSAGPLASLDGIDRFEGLEKLQLFGAKSLERLGNLTPLPKLRELMLFQNGLVTLSGLPELPSLERIETSDNRILSARLAGLPALRELEMHEEDLLSVELGELPSLESVDLRGESSLIQDGGRLENLVIASQPKLERLDLRRNHLQHLAGLAPQPELQLIRIDRNPWNDLERLRNGFPSLTNISIHRTQVSEIPADLQKAGLAISHDASEVEAQMWEGVLRQAFENMRDSFVENVPGTGGTIEGYSAHCSFRTSTFSTPRLNCTVAIERLTGVAHLNLITVDPLNPTSGGPNTLPVRAVIRTRTGRARVYLKYRLDIRAQAEALASYNDRERPWFAHETEPDPENVKDGYTFAEATPERPGTAAGEAHLLVDQVIIWVEGLEGAGGIELVLE